ncbi:MAG: hypothetical protein QNJ44_11315 [Rhodobacter sp.]|nr:hypothetical protein [Rhodobacter sp.]
MFGRLIWALVLVATVAGCSRVAESRFNPFNWFGRSEQATAVTTNPNADPRPLIGQVIALRVEQVPGGAIVRATGLPNRQGYFDGALVPLNRELPQDGVLSYQFRISAPFQPTRVGTPQSREVLVGRFVSEQTLQGVRQIRVSGAANALAVRR